ncbi:MAG: phytanoyl-CoA dioxygenase family protein [Pseudomonadota bacterium]
MRREQFQQQGFLTYPDALAAEELSTLRGACDTLLEEPVDDGGGEKHRIGKGEARRFLAHRHEEFPNVEALLVSSKIGAVVNECLGGDSSYLFNEQFVVKGAGKGASFAWHQDSAYVGFDHAAYLTVWIALDDATEDNGCVYLIPRDLEAQPEIDPHEWDENGNELNGYFGKESGKPMLASAGDIVTFSSLTLHRSGPNITSQPRRAYVCQYTAEPLIDPETGAPKRFAKPVGRA